MNRKLLARPALFTALILLVPLTMTLLDRGKPLGEGWHWKPLDFLVMGALLLGAGTAYEWLAARLKGKLQRTAAAVVLLVIVLCIWAELAVGALSKGMGMLLGG